MKSQTDGSAHADQLVWLFLVFLEPKLVAAWRWTGFKNVAASKQQTSRKSCPTRQNNERIHQSRKKESWLICAEKTAYMCLKSSCSLEAAGQNGEPPCSPAAPRSGWSHFIQMSGFYPKNNSSSMVRNETNEPPCAACRGRYREQRISCHSHPHRKLSGNHT